MPPGGQDVARIVLDLHRVVTDWKWDQEQDTRASKKKKEKQEKQDK